MLIFKTSIWACALLGAVWSIVFGLLDLIHFFPLTSWLVSVVSMFDWKIFLSVFPEKPQPSSLFLLVRLWDWENTTNKRRNSWQKNLEYFQNGQGRSQLVWNVRDVSSAGETGLSAGAGVVATTATTPVLHYSSQCICRMRQSRDDSVLIVLAVSFTI